MGKYVLAEEEIAQRFHAEILQSHEFVICDDVREDCDLRETVRRDRAHELTGARGLRFHAVPCGEAVHLQRVRRRVCDEMRSQLARDRVREHVLIREREEEREQEWQRDDRRRVVGGAAELVRRRQLGRRCRRAVQEPQERFKVAAPLVELQVVLPTVRRYGIAQCEHVLCAETPRGRLT